MILEHMLKKHLFHRALKSPTSEYNLATPPCHSNSQADNHCARQLQSNGEICTRQGMLGLNYWVAAREVTTQRCVGIACSSPMQNKNPSGQELSSNLCQEEANTCQPSIGQVQYCGKRSPHGINSLASAREVPRCAKLTKGKGIETCMHLSLATVKIGHSQTGHRQLSLCQGDAQ